MADDKPQPAHLHIREDLRQALDREQLDHRIETGQNLSGNALKVALLWEALKARQQSRAGAMTGDAA